MVMLFVIYFSMSLSNLSLNQRWIRIRIWYSWTKTVSHTSGSSQHISTVHSYSSYSSILHDRSSTNELLFSIKVSYTDNSTVYYWTKVLSERITDAKTGPGLPLRRKA